MKWYNKDKTKMLNLDSVDGYVYIPAKEYIEQYPNEKDVEDFKINGDRLELIISGTPYVFRNETAKEIFGLINNNGKQVL